MKPLFDQDQPSSDISNEASTSSQPNKYHDQERGSNSTSSAGISGNNNNHDPMMKNTCNWCFSPRGMDLNPSRKVLAEALGTFILVFCVHGIIAITQLMPGEIGLLEYAATGALTVVVVVFSIGAISGAHVNPAITIAFAAFGQFPWSKVLFYVLAQVTGSVLATYVGWFVYGIKPELLTTRPLHGSAAAFLMELIATLIVMLVASSLTYQAKYVGHLSGFVMGIAIGLAVLITGPISGGSMNPARSLGPAIVSRKFDDVWIYIVAPTIGAVGGASLFHALRLQPQPRSNTSPNAALPSQSNSH